jgi:hypothetical protein
MMKKLNEFNVSNWNIVDSYIEKLKKLVKKKDDMDFSSFTKSSFNLLKQHLKKNKIKKNDDKFIQEILTSILIKLKEDKAIDCYLIDKMRDDLIFNYDDYLRLSRVTFNFEYDSFSIKANSSHSQISESQLDQKKHDFGIIVYYIIKMFLKNYYEDKYCSPIHSIQSKLILKNYN